MITLHLEEVQIVDMVVVAEEIIEEAVDVVSQEAVDEIREEVDVILGAVGILEMVEIPEMEEDDLVVIIEIDTNYQQDNVLLTNHPRIIFLGDFFLFSSIKTIAHGLVA